MNALATTPTSAAGAKTYMLSGGSAFAPPPLHTADFNHLAYNPNVTYTAPVKADGTPVTNTGTDANGNYGTTSTFWNTASVDRDPYSAYETAAGVTPMWSAATKDNMSLKMAVPLYCNTDWPLLVNDAYWPGGPNGATALDAGTTNGQYSAGTGGWCRINGTKYDLSAASGAPAVADDYNYPWQSSSGATGAQYFYRQLGTKTLWCDNTSPYWPKTQGALIGCTGGVFTPGTTEPQILQALELRQHVHGFLPGADVQGHGHQHDVLRCQRDLVFAAGNRKLAGMQGVHLRPQYAEGQRRLSPDLDRRRRVRGGLQLHRCGLRAARVSAISRLPQPTCTGGTPVYTWTAAGSIACNSQLWDPVAGAPSATTALADAGAPGTVPARPGRPAATTTTPMQWAALPDCSSTAHRRPRYPRRRRGHAPIKFNQAATSGCPAVGTTVQIPRHYYVGRLGPVLQRPHRHGGHAVEGLRHRRLPGQERPDQLQGRQVRQVHARRPVPRQRGSVPRQLQSGGQRHPVSERSGLARRRHPGPGQLRVDQLRQLVRVLLDASQCRQVHVGDRLFVPDRRRRRPIAYRVGFHNLGEEPPATAAPARPSSGPTSRTGTSRSVRRGTASCSASRYRRTRRRPSTRCCASATCSRTGTAAGLPAEVNPLPAAAADPVVQGLQQQHDQLPEQLPHPLHRRQDQPGLAAEHHAGANATSTRRSRRS